ncbi:amino-acid permease [Raphidocelis subcapitata]|uniref:Amino-acid permease n=1 Tax=Raphidocelis subcapitata TaxID=307507 RepID=A0A2V0PN14_9CHLO|nr:amino-acid permease [Raphidocelis subcapitata]|eukprot:GBF99453.1 amino-acid permease [Raphidocelis subcapitata]
MGSVDHTAAGEDPFHDLSKDGCQDAEVLARLGYRQVLYRTWGTLTAVALTISAMSTLTSISASFGTGLMMGGPAICVWGWIAVSAATLCIGLGMAELASAYPTSGGMYYWMSKLAGKRVGPWACWVTGWLNLLGQIAAVSAVAALAADLTITMATMASGLDGKEPIEVDNKQYFGIFAAYILLNAIMNSLGLAWLTLLTQIGAFFNIAGVVLLCLVVPIVAPRHRSAKYVFTKFDTRGAQGVGITNPFYAAMLGLLLPAYSYTGVDGPVHMAEEVTGSETAPPIAILYGIGIMFVGGLAMIIALLFSMKSITRALNEDSEAGGSPIPQILYDVFTDRYNNPRIGIALQIIPLGGVFFCLVATTTYVTRILFCYSRDRAVPLPWLWSRMNKRTRSPLCALWVRGAEAPRPPTAPQQARGQPAIATVWAIVATVIFCLPTELPVDGENLNYASVLLVGTFLMSNVWFFFPKYGAYKWFTGPARTIDDDSVMGLEGGGAPGSMKKDVEFDYKDADV